MKAIDERVLDALVLDWRKNTILPGGETEEVSSLASVRELAEYLDKSESTIRSSVRRLREAGKVMAYQLLDTDHGVRRLYVISAERDLEHREQQMPSMAELLFGGLGS